MRPEIAQHEHRPDGPAPGQDATTTAHATGVLVLALRLPVTAAEAALQATARRYRVPVDDLATAVATTASGAEVTDRGLAEVVATEWGDLLA